MSVINGIPPEGISMPDVLEESVTKGQIIKPSYNLHCKMNNYYNARIEMIKKP